MPFYSKTARGFFESRDHAPDDAIEITDDDRTALLAGEAAGKCIDADADGKPVLVDKPAPTQEQLKAACVDAIQAEMDRQAQSKGYDNLMSACSFAPLPAGSPFQAESMAFLAWRAQVWSDAYADLAEVDAGTKPMPTPQEVVAAMPALVLPA